MAHLLPGGSVAEEAEMDELLAGYLDKKWEGRDEYLKNLLNDDDGEVPLLAETVEEMDPALVEALMQLRDGGETAADLAAAAKDRGNKQYATAVRTRKERSKAAAGPKEPPRLSAGKVCYFREAAREYSDGLALCLAAEHEKITPPAHDEGEETQARTVRAVKAALLTNRAQCSLILKNYGLAKRDCRDALQVEPGNFKAWFRLSKACAALGQWADAAQAAEFGLAETSGGAEAAGAGAEALAEARRGFEAQRRKEAAALAACQTRELGYRELWAAAAVVGARLGPTEPRHVRRPPEGTARSSPHLNVAHDDDDGCGGGGTSDRSLRWPVLFAYPEQVDAHPDLVESMGVDDVLAAWLAELFPEDGPGPHWDARGAYRCSQLAVYTRRRAVAPFSSIDAYVTFRERGHNASTTSGAAHEKNDDEDDDTTADDDDDAHDEWFEVSPAAMLRDLLLAPTHVAPPVITLEVRPRASAMHAKWRRHVEKKAGLIFVGLKINADGSLAE